MALAAARKRLLAFAACASLCDGSVSAAPAALAAAFDQARIHAYYTDGEFDKVIKELEAFSKSRRACTHAESVFVEKHLSVVYAAHPGTRERGRYHMYRLLDLSPGTDLLDMFVGEEVGGVFDKVGKEYALRNPAKTAAKKPAPAAVAHAGSKPQPRAATPAPSAAPASKGSTSADKRIQDLVNARPPLPAAETRPAADKRTSSPISGPAKPAPMSSAPARPAPVSYRLPAPRPPPSADKRTVSRDSAFASKGPASRPAWKEPGLWIGGGAAFAVVAFTLFYSGSEAAPAGKTYVVPAAASR